MKFLHCADIHIDSPLRGLSAYEGAPVDEIRGATRRAFENLVDLAVDQEVAAVVIAGDLYDGDRDDFNTAMFLHRHYERLRDEGIAVVVVHGNHDAANDITRRLRVPDNVVTFPADEPATFELGEAGLAVHGRSYPTRVVHEDFASSYPAPVPGMVNVGVLHTSLSGREGPHQVYAPCTEETLAARGYQYWALGHVHERYETVRDGTGIVYPGNLQGRKSNEVGAKGATLVTYDESGITGVEHRVLDVVRWEVLDAVVDGIGDPDAVSGRVLDRLAPMIDAADGRLLAVRVRVGGTTEAADVLWRDRERWEAQLRADAGGAGGRVWIEKVQLGVRAPEVASVEMGEAITAVREAIRRLMGEPDGCGPLAAELGDLRSKLGTDLEELVELGAPALDAQGVRDLLGEVEEILLAELRAGGS